MKAILEFNLPEDKSDHSLAVNASKLYCILENISNIVRSYYKYRENPNIDDLIKEIQEELYESRWEELGE